MRHWRFDERCVTLNGEQVYPWRAVDHERAILESYTTKTSDEDAAFAFMKNALIVTADPGRSSPTDGAGPVPR